MKGTKSIRRVLFIHFTSASLIPLLLLLLTLTILLNRNIRVRAIESNEALTTSVAREIRSYLDYIDSIGRWGAFHARVHGNSPDELQYFLSNMSSYFPFFESVLIADPAGIVQATYPADPDMVGNNINGQPFFQSSVATGKVQWSETFISTYTNSPTLAAVFPSGTNYLIGYINLTHLATIGKQTTSAGTSELIILDSRGNLLVHPDYQLVLQQYNFSQYQMVKDTLNGKTGFFDTRFEDKNVFFTSERIDPTGWGILVLQEKREVFAIAYQLLFPVGALIFLAAALSTILAFFSRRQVVRPIYQLMKNTQAIAEGRYGVSSELSNSYREMNYLVRTISRMSEKIARRETELKKNLEEKEILLKEVHHRVKNNLQLILSILNLKNFSVDDPATKAVLQDNIGRIYTISQVHQQLYSSADLAKIDIASYISTLTAYLVSHTSDSQHDFRTNIQIDDLAIGIDQAIPLGIIIFELFSNSLKHSTLSGQVKTITVKGDILDGEFRLLINDDGRPFDPSLFSEPDSLGFNIVHELIRQLQGSIQYTAAEGNTFHIDFPL